MILLAEDGPTTAATASGASCYRPAIASSSRPRARFADAGAATSAPRTPRASASTAVGAVVRGNGVDLVLEPTLPMVALARGPGYDRGHAGGQGDPMIALTALWDMTGMPVASLPGQLGGRRVADRAARARGGADRCRRSTSRSTRSACPTGPRSPRRSQPRVAPADATSCSPSANSSTIFAQNAGRSSGLREDTRPWSTTTSSSTHVAAGVADVGPQARARGQRAAAHEVGLDQRPRAVADHADRLAASSKNVLHERDRVVVHPQAVRVGDAARQDQPVVVVGAGVADALSTVNLSAGSMCAFIAWISPVVERQQLGRAAGVLDRLARLDELDLLDAVGGDDRDLLSVQVLRHALILNPVIGFVPGP